MTKKLFLTGILAIALVFGFTVAGCVFDPQELNENESGDGFTLTGIPEDYNGNYIFIIGSPAAGSPAASVSRAVDDAEDETERIMIVGAASINDETVKNEEGDDIDVTMFTFVKISGGKATVPLWTYDGGKATKFTGDATLEMFVFVSNLDKATGEGAFAEGNLIAGIFLEGVKLNKGKVTQPVPNTGFSTETGLSKLLDDYDDWVGGGEEEEPGSGTDPDPEDGFTLTGIPPKFNNKYIFIHGEAATEDDDDDDDEIMIYGAATIDMGEQKFTLIKISDGKAIVPIWIIDEDGAQKYEGNDTFHLRIFISSEAEFVGEEGYPDCFYAGNDFIDIIFEDGSYTLPLATGDLREEDDFLDWIGYQGEFTLEGLDDYDSSYIYIVGLSDGQKIVGAESVELDDEALKFMLIQIEDGIATIPMWIIGDELQNYFGNAELDVFVFISSAATVVEGDFDEVTAGILLKDIVEFEKGNFSYSFDDADVFYTVDVDLEDLIAEYETIFGDG